MERELLQQIWPIFSAEAREHLQAISDGVLELEEDPSRAGVLDVVRRTAHSLKGSAGSLGLGELERLAHAIEGSLSKFDPAEGISRAGVQAALDAVQAIEEALAAGDAGTDPVVPRFVDLLQALGAPVRASDRKEPAPAAAPPPAPAAPPAPSVFLGPPPGAPDAPVAPAASPGLALLDKLEEACANLCSPLDPDARRAAAEGAVEDARKLAELAPPPAAPLVLKVAEAFAVMAAAGPEGARGAAAIAGDLVDLRTALEAPPEGTPTVAAAVAAAQPAPAPVAAPAAPAAAPAPAAHAAPAADKSIRVLTSTMDSLTRQLELLALGEARHARRAREIREAEASLRDVVRGLERASQALRLGAPDDARTELPPALDRLRVLATELSRLARDGQRDADSQKLTGTVLRDDLRAMRMVPASVALEPLKRAVRDVAGRLGKEVELTIAGGDVRLDRRVVDELRDPLLHLVRNAVDHGLETPDRRRAVGKAAKGHVKVRVEPRGTRVGVVIEDDGSGLDVAAVRASAVRKGVVTPEAAARMSDDEAARLVFAAGLSTKAAVTEISGRGVGLDVVQDTVTRLQGTVDVAWTPGEGTRFDLEVPLTLAAAAALLFRFGREVAALPADAVDRVLLLSDKDIGTVAGRATVKVGGAQIPFAPLAPLMGLSAAAPDVRSRFRPALVVAAGAQRVALGIEEVLGQQDLVVSDLGSRVSKVTHLAGAAVLDDGRVVGVLSATELVRRAQPALAARAAGPSRVRLVVADDSLTTRTAMKTLLEIAGYAVLPAADGEEAFQLLGTSGAALVVSDVQMPRLDGLGLARKIKADARLRSTPVILVTSLDAPEDRAAGLEAGADGYLVKREVERGKLLELVRQLLPART
ncbi:MAG: response regulator [Anaeromyxobacter sp.]